MTRLRLQIDCPTGTDATKLARAVKQNTIGYVVRVVHDWAGNTGPHYIVEITLEKTND